MYPTGCRNDVARYNEGLPKILKEVLLLQKEWDACKKGF